MKRMIYTWRARLRALARRILGLKPKLPKTERRFRLVVNEKAVARPDIQLAIDEMRTAGLHIEVTPTTGPDDAVRLSAVPNTVADVVIAAGGDGTLQQVAEGLLQVRTTRRPAMALVPAGTANDFAAGCLIPAFPHEALLLAAVGRAHSIDVMRVTGLMRPTGDGALPGKSEQPLAVNVVTAAFVDEHATEVSDDLKRLIGGPAYWIAGVLRTLQLRPRRIRWAAEEASGEDDLVVLTVANGRQTGGGSQVAPHAQIDDGLVDVRLIRAFDLADFPAVVREVGDPAIVDPRFVVRFTTRRISFSAAEPWDLTLDGEPRRAARINVEVLHKALRMVLPEAAPLRPRTHH